MTGVQYSRLENRRAHGVSEEIDLRRPGVSRPQTCAALSSWREWMALVNTDRSQKFLSKEMTDPKSGGVDIVSFSARRWRRKLSPSGEAPKPDPTILDASLIQLSGMYQGRFQNGPCASWIMRFRGFIWVCPCSAWLPLGVIVAEQEPTVSLIRLQ